ncbi:DnaJ domain protein [Talaromyces stipitatus ATCC 10500]|uniref:DnaJ domain protein n=1 Tax=Talaromyces stipitatus (strain ATCC 10500 / CBS 375.48 / QM 6759 / NRRL 1006) TaxID=441959 RepID=B8M847_TALSN|nr:DnaJ domain protein [Talaromyces stipitatus ATCC 10500]EED20009.1 DnaJ domain protein [Talaromyces stipitatus ATCC 10500]
MSSNLPDFDPYTVLGVDKNAPNSAIKTAYRKLVLKCHPDKVQDESLREKAVNDFQKLQESYEILSDDTRRQIYDQEVYLNALRKESAAQKAYASREYRDGRMYEERVPADAGFFTSSDDMFYSEEPVSYSQKYYDSAKRPHTKASEERKKAKSMPVYTYSTTKAAKQSDRDYAKAAHNDRAKTRTKERRQEFSDKYERYATHVSDSDDEPGTVRYTAKVEVETRYPSHRESVPPRRSKTETAYTTTTSHRRHDSPDGSDSEHSYDYDEFDKEYSKLDGQQAWAKEYIGRKKDPVIRSHSSRHAEAEERERRHSETPRYSTRSSHNYKEVHVEPSSPRTSRRSHERLDSPDRSYDYERDRERDRDRDRDRDRERRERQERREQRERDIIERERELERRERELERGRTVPSLSTAASQKVSSRAPPTMTRSATAPYPPRSSRREGSSRSESKGAFSGLVNMVSSLTTDAKVSASRPSNARATSRARGVSRTRVTERHDSGYSSGPSTPEMPQGASAKIKQYKYVDAADRSRETIVVEPDRYSPPPPPSSSKSERTRDRSAAPSAASRRIFKVYIEVNFKVFKVFINQSAPFRRGPTVP